MIEVNKMDKGDLVKSEWTREMLMYCFTDINKTCEAEGVLGLTEKEIEALIRDWNEEE